MNNGTIISWKKRIGWTAAVIAAGAGIVAILHVRTTDTAGLDAMPAYTVERGPLTISIIQSGTIQATQKEIITCEVEGRDIVIIDLIEEGARVSEGDLLVKLDSSDLEDRLLDQQIRVQNAEAAFIRARETLGVVSNQAVSDISLAQLNYRFAQEDLAQFEEGEYPQRLLSAEAKITLAEEELQLASQKLEWSEKLFEESYISQSERDSDRLSFNRAKLNLELAREDKRLLEDFTYTRELATLESDIEQTRLALERARLKSSADIVQAEANLKASQSEWRQQRDRERHLEKQIELTEIRAPRDGLVVYATSTQVNWRGRIDPLDVGQVVRQRQELIHLPTADLMKAEVMIHESNLKKLQLGLPARITLDTLPNRNFSGTVTRIAPLPDAFSMRMNPDLKVYQTEIELKGRQPDIRTGMSCVAEIIVEEYEDVLFVPLQAVVRRNGVPTVYRRGEREFIPVPVEIGMDNNRMIHVLDGLEEGDRAWLTPPLNQGRESREIRPAEDLDEEPPELPAVAPVRNRARETPNRPKAETPR